MLGKKFEIFDKYVCFKRRFLMTGFLQMNFWFRNTRIKEKSKKKEAAVTWSFSLLEART